MKTFLDTRVPLDGAAWSEATWAEVELFLDRRCSREELIWLGDTAGLVIPLPDVGELEKGQVLTLLRELSPRTMADRYRALLARRRDTGPRRFPTGGKR